MERNTKAESLRQSAGALEIREGPRQTEPRGVGEHSQTEELQQGTEEEGGWHREAGGIKGHCEHVGPEHED